MWQQLLIFAKVLANSIFLPHRVHAQRIADEFVGFGRGDALHAKSFSVGPDFIVHKDKCEKRVIREFARSSRSALRSLGHSPQEINGLLALTHQTKYPSRWL